MKKQSQESQSKTQVKMDPESEGFTDLSNCRKQLEWDEVMRILEASSKGHIMLSYEHKTILEAISRGQYVFVTGSIGTAIFLIL